MAARDVSAQSDLSKLKHEVDGSFKRQASSFRDVIEPGGKFEPESDRYHLYVAYICPWATRALIVRKLKGLEDIIPVTTTSPRMGAEGWPFASVDPFPGAEDDPLYGSKHIKDLYLKADPEYSGRFTVPVLWDKKNETIVNNESSEIIRIFNSAFNHLLPAEKAAVDLYPEELRGEIDAVNDWIYSSINNGVYRAGFSTKQEGYDKAVREVFEGLDRVEKLLDGKDYLVGGRLTEADVRLWVTVIRFDVAYHGHFKCNFRTIRDGYPAIDLWARKLYWNVDAFKSSTKFDHIKTGYYSQVTINPTKIIPAGPIPDIRPL
ncbi:hypothetical protein D9611_010448 [Ephemerocybe angulata]|uniref:GST C-terminal domain-containing protein n=1 Tax=Ephemerocybe angulata TaxID=980116 RepID=A0A8H5BWT2_9AGAR|nr:hypothetical protein D9611_010448 [Tulosesus angulatus]